MNPLNHVAIIMDGNGRWGIKNKKSRNAGHKAGLNTVEKIIKDKYGEKYSNRKQYNKKSKNSQEAHEAIRPTDLGIAKLEQKENYTFDHVKIYNLIYNRTIASQMSPAKIQNITINVNIYEDDSLVKDYWFISKNQKVLFDPLRFLNYSFSQHL